MKNLSSASENEDIVTKKYVDDGLSSKASTSHTHSDLLAKSGGTMTGALVAQCNTSYTVAQVRNCTMSTSAASGGGNGDIHFTYTA